MRAGPDIPVPEESKFLSALPREAAEALAVSARSRLLTPREHGVRQGDPSLGLLWLHTGLLSVFYELADGSIHPHRVAWPNEVSTQGAIEETEYPSSCKALVPSQFYWVPYDAVSSLLEEVAGFTHSLFCYIARQEERLAVWTSHLLSLPVRDRLRLVLARMAVEMGNPDAGRYLLGFPVTNAALAVAAHVSRDEAGRAVRELVSEGLAQRARGRRFVVPSVHELLGPRLLEMGRRVGVVSGHR